MRTLVRTGFAAISLLAAVAATAAQPRVVTKAAFPSANAPKAFAFPGGPDAEALLLADRYTLRADGAVVHECTLRMKVNSSLAINRDFGESRVVWDPAVETFEVLHNRTVRPSGEVVPGPANAIVDELPPAVHRNPLWSRLRRRVIVHTALEPGAVIEASWRVTRAASSQVGMTVAEPLAFAFPVAQRLVEVEAPAGVELVASAAAEGGPAADCTTTGASRTCRWRLESVAALPAEPGTPARVEFEPYALAAAGAPAGKGWAAAELQRRWDAAGPVPAGAIEAVRKAVGSEPDRERAFLAALTAVGDAINVSATLPAAHTGWTISPLASVWAAGWASPLEMAALQARALGEIGFEARPGLVLAGPQAASAPGFALHDRAVLLVRFGEGDDRLYDPCEPAAEKPLESNLDHAHLVVPGSPVSLGALAAPWRRRLVASLKIDEKGGVKGELALTTVGGATPHAGLVRDPQKLAERLAGGLFEGAKVTSARTTRLERGEASLSASFDGALPEKNARGLYAVTLAGVPGGVTDELPPLPGAGRLSPIAIPGPGGEELEFTLDLPKGWTVAALPAPAQAANTVGEVAVSGAPGADGKVVVRRHITLAGRRAPAAEAGKVRELLIAWSSPGSRVLLLRPPAGKP
jgi:hypothetical protein